MTNLVSSMPLIDWRGAATKFASFYDVLPADEIENATWGEVLAFIAPCEGLIVGADKATLPFIVPCALKEAPYTANTATKTGRASGKQRSAAHATVAHNLIIDVDGLRAEALDETRDKLQEVGLTFLRYSTHSHGREDKPGVRARLVVPVDRALDAAQYEQAWLGFDLMFCGGAVAAQDASGRKLWQQQGVWVAHPDRVGVAFRHVHKAGVASADALFAAAPKRVARSCKNLMALTPGTFGDVERRKVTAALGLLEPNNYETWVTVCACLVALRVCLGDDALRLWLEFSEKADEASKARNDVAGTNPETMFERMTPTITADAAIGTLMARAKDAALSTAEIDLIAGALTARGFDAVQYLTTYHRATLDALLSNYEVQL